jgi:hypothetical protein
VIIMITLDSLWKDYLVLIDKASGCVKQINTWNSTIAGKHADKTTVKDMFDILEKSETLSDVWIVWALQKFGKELSEDVRLRLYDGIKEPRVAAQIYFDFSYLTDREDDKLIKIFQGKLPTIEKEIAENLVSRKKVSL